jgi:arylsulfatase
MMNSWTENTWLAAIMGPAVKTLMKTYVEYPPRKVQSDAYSGPLLISDYEKFEYLRNSLAKDGVTLNFPSGN